MKKLILLAAAAFVGFSSGAQEAGSFNLSGMKQAVQPYNIGNHTPTSSKSTISGSRWYNHAGMVNEYLTNQLMDFGIFPIWFDSTIGQVFNTGLGTINFSSAGQAFDPIYFTLWNDPNVSDPNAIAIEPESNYSVDSVSFFGFYVEDIDRPLTVVDTLIFSVGTVNSGVETPQQRFPSVYPWVQANGYTCGTGCGDSTLVASRIGPSDSVNRTSAVTGVVTWKVPIDSSLREPDSAGIVFGKEFTYPVMVGGVPGSVNIPAGRLTGVTVTFKTGDIHNPGDSINKYNRMYIHSGEGLGPSTFMPYFYYTHRDHNMSNLMFATAPSFYAASIIIEGVNTIDYFQEFHNISAHIVCTDCPTVTEYASVHNVNNALSADVLAYPNPAENEITVSFILNQNTNAKVYITDAVGKLIATQDVSATARKETKANFSTAGLSSGIYFYTVEAKGQRTTNRFVVSH